MQAICINIHKKIRLYTLRWTNAANNLR